MSLRSLWLALSLALLAPAMAYAASVDPLIEGAKLCTRHLPRYEREYGIPTHLLSAIASTESGRYHDGLKIKVPWPWAVNVDGKSYYYDSKLEAIHAVKRYQAKGAQSIDVGCMQVNLIHHKHAFSSLEEAFEPENNIAYAASFLRGLYQEEGSWKKAAADYHSKTPSLGREYVGQVYDSWYQIIDKLRAARLQVPDPVAMNELKGGGAYQIATAPAPVARPVVHKITPLPEQIGKKVAAYKSPHMNSITVSKNGRREEQNGVIIVRPPVVVVDDKPAPPAAAMPMVTPAEMTIVQSQAAAPTVLPALAPSAAPPSPAKKSGPTFIFSD